MNFGELLRRGIPAYFWVMVAYLLVVGFVLIFPPDIPRATSSTPAQVEAEQAEAAAEDAQAAAAEAEQAAEQAQEAADAEAAAASGGESASESAAEAAAEGAPVEEPGRNLGPEIEYTLQKTVFTMPLMSGSKLPITITTLFIIACIISGWIEALRATRLRDRGGNDFMSLLVTVVAIILFVGLSAFGTTAFLIVTLTGIGDLLLDRMVGQAVARRDFGAMVGPGSS